MSKNTPLSLEFDRKKSKRLLRHWRKGEKLELLQEYHPRYYKLPHVLQDLTLRDAQLVVAREYGFESWQSLLNHLKNGLNPQLLKTFEEAQLIIKDKDSDKLTKLLKDNPELIHLEHPEHGHLIDCTQSYANYVADEEDFWTSFSCARVLLEGGSDVPESVYTRAMTTGSRKMVELFREHQKISLSLRLIAVVGSAAELSARLEEEDWQQQDRTLLLADAFFYACRHFLEKNATLLLEKAKQLEPQLAEVEIELFFATPQELQLDGQHTILQQSHLLQLKKALRNDDAKTFAELLEQNSWLLQESELEWQRTSLEECAYGGFANVAQELLRTKPRLIQDPRPRCRALPLAIEYGQEKLVSLLQEHWEPAPEVPIFAGLGLLAELKACFDDQGILRPEFQQMTMNDYGQVKESSKILQHAFGLACMNEQLEVLEFLLQLGIPIDSPWGLHEPASFLHESAGHGKLETVEFLVSRGASTEILDERYQCTPLQWAEFMGQSKVVEFLNS